eukprot:1471407-Karenia_brevis.AAC.1
MMMQTPESISEQHGSGARDPVLPRDVENPLDQSAEERSLPPSETDVRGEGSGDRPDLGFLSQSSDDELVRMMRAFFKTMIESNK